MFKTVLSKRASDMLKNSNNPDLLRGVSMPKEFQLVAENIYARNQDRSLPPISTQMNHSPSTNTNSQNVNDVPNHSHPNTAQSATDTSSLLNGNNFVTNVSQNYK